MFKCNDNGKLSLVLLSVLSIGRKLPLIAVLCAFMLAISHNTTLAQEQDSKAPEKEIGTVELLNPQSDIAEFKLRLAHLTQGELKKFAGEWMSLVQAKTKEVAETYINLAAAEGDAVSALRTKLNGVIEQRNSLFAKQMVILTAWEAKGAKPEAVAEYHNYIAAVRRSELKSTDIGTLSRMAVEWLGSSDGGLEIGIWLLSLVGSIIAVIFLAGILTGFIRRALYRIPDISDLLRNFMSRMVYWLILGIGLIIALSLFGINMTPLLAVFGGASFIIGFAMQSTLGNLASGLLLMVTKPFDVGDVVNAAGVSGTVKSVSIVSTTILTFDNQVNVVPNTMVWDSIITNVNASATRRVDLVFGIGYDDDIELAMKTLNEIITSHPLVLKDPEPNIRLNELADSSVNFICRPWAKTEDYWTVYWDIMQQAKEQFDKVGLSIPFPQQDVHIHQIEQSSKE